MKKSYSKYWPYKKILTVLPWQYFSCTGEVSVLVTFKKKGVNRISSFFCVLLTASRYISVIKTNLMHYLASVYFFNQPLHVSGMFIHIYIYIYIYIYI